MASRKGCEMKVSTTDLTPLSWTPSQWDFPLSDRFLGKDYYCTLLDVREAKKYFFFHWGKKKLMKMKSYALK